MDEGLEARIAALEQANAALTARVDVLAGVLDAAVLGLTVFWANAQPSAERADEWAREIIEDFHANLPDGHPAHPAIDGLSDRLLENVRLGDP